MRKCPFIKECEEKVTPRKFKNQCRIIIGLIFGFGDCHTYLAMKRDRENQKRKLPREFLAEVESK